MYPIRFRSAFIAHMSSKRLRSERGLTLVEIIVVLIILSIVGGFLISKVIGAGDTAKMDITKMKMREIQSAIEQFRLRYNGIPSSMDSLLRCTDETGQDCIPILKQDQIKDSWGNPLIYQRDGDGRTYKIRTLGADGRDGGEGINYDVSITGP